MTKPLLLQRPCCFRLHACRLGSNSLEAWYDDVQVLACDFGVVSLHIGRVRCVRLHASRRGSDSLEAWYVDVQFLAWP